MFEVHIHTWLASIEKVNSFLKKWSHVSRLVLRMPFGAYQCCGVTAIESEGFFWFIKCKHDHFWCHTFANQMQLSRGILQKKKHTWNLMLLINDTVIVVQNLKLPSSLLMARSPKLLRCIWVLVICSHTLIIKYIIKIYWIHCIYRLIVGKENLTILNVTDKDDGTYTCVANTSLDSVSASAVLTVVGKIVFKIHKDKTKFIL